MLAVVFSIAAERLFQLVDFAPAWLISAPAVAGSFGILFGVLERIAWRWRFIQTFGIIGTPVIRGVYNGTLVSSYNNTELPIAIEIEQTWTSMIVRFRVSRPESSVSVSMAASLAREGKKDARLTYFYRNTVKPGIAQVDMNDHDGTAEILIDTSTGAASGRYYNYRGNQGRLALQRTATP